ncbi:MAG: hypothetical protein IJ770_03110 [Alphaproteobacteria bacterium]|nr:hypothetical protein [Alphaproteobacteria bacterium]
MAIDDRYVFVEKPPQIGEALANTPMLQKYAEVLSAAENNMQNGDGAYYSEEPVAREVSYCYILNSVYRELLKWQNKQPDNQEIVQLRQDVAAEFPNFLRQEFPHIGENYVVNADFIEFDTKDSKTGDILNPKECDIDEKTQAKLQSFIERIDAFLQNNERQQTYDDASFQERERFKKFDQVSFGALRKMQYYLAEKTENKHVYSFQSTAEKARAHRNTLKKQIETLTNITADNAGDFERNQQVVSNTLDGLGMRMVWCQEPPYEAEFVDNLYFMKKDLQQEQTPPEFYNTKLPVFLNLCKNMEEFNPSETQKMSALLKDFMENPSKEKLIATIDETQRTALELREIDQTKSRVMRAAWSGMILEPTEKQLSAAVRDVLKMRDLVGRQGLSEEKQQQLDAFLKADYTPEEYEKNLKKNKIWNICKQIPQFQALETALLAQMKAMSIPPQEVANLKYEDLTFLINRRKITNYKSMANKNGVEIASDKEKYLKNLVAKHEKELRQTMFAYFKKKYTLPLTLEGHKQHKTNQEIAESIRNRAQKEKDAAIEYMQHGKSHKDCNAHHIFPLSNISYYERMTGKSFTKINEDILYINKDVHELLHINENAMDEKGRLHLGKDMACRTKYIHRDRMITHGRKVEGYFDRAVMGIIMPKDGITVMADLNSYVFEPAELSKNVKLQAQKIEYRQAYDTYMLNQTQQRVEGEIDKIPVDTSMESTAAANLKKQMEQASTPREYCDFAGKFFRLQAALKRKLNIEKAEPTPTQQGILNVNTKYTQPLATLPHISSGKVSLFLTQAVDLLQNKAKEIVMSLRETQAREMEHSEQTSSLSGGFTKEVIMSAPQADDNSGVREEMDKARRMVEQKSDAAEKKVVPTKFKNLKIKKKQTFASKTKQYA